MQLFPALEQRYSHEHQSAGEAQRLAQEIARLLTAINAAEQEEGEK